MQLHSYTRTGICLAAFLSLASCSQNNVALQPADAPVPVSADMTFVDVTGCSWWVIGNATSLSWAPMTNGAGEHVCDEGQTRIAPPASEMPATPMIAATPIEDAVPMNAPMLDAAPAALPAAVPISGSGFTVQVASFAKASNASASVALFEKLGFPTSAPPQGGEPDLYRLILGPFASTAEAQRALSTAKAEGFGDAFIVN